jgi:hypothetical protein
LVFLAFGLSGVVGPMMGGWLFDVSSSYLTAISLAALVTLTGAAGTWRLLAPRGPARPAS